MPNEDGSTLGSPEGSDMEDFAGSLLRDVAAISEVRTGEELVSPALVPGDVVADQFVVEQVAGSGGMGTVYRARNRMTGELVALKLMARPRKDDPRFAQEARVLSELMHPAIVRYVAHGTTPRGQPFLAMEWLHGEDLSKQIAKKGLGVSESLAIARRVAEGLAVAHAHGLVHRDVKPSNVFLVGGDPLQAKLLDFGIVRVRLSAHDLAPMTRTGMVLGTVGYMSPEQAIARQQVDARTDVFALGCVLFECLTGKPAFSGANVVAVLAKVLHEEAPRVRQIRADLPSSLDDLVSRMLSKDRAARPADGDAVLRELSSLEHTVVGARESRPERSPGLSGAEQRLVGVMVVVTTGAVSRVDAIVRRHGGEVAHLANGALLVTLQGHGSATEQIATAAACALELREELPSLRLALAMGRAETSGGGPTGAVIDQAAALLSQSGSAGIRVDDATAALLGERFELQPEGKAHSLVGQRGLAEPPRMLLGKRTACVGRDKELTLLEGTLRECIEESSARAVLVTGPPGQGKSRLRHEFLERVSAQGGVRVLSASGHPVGAGSAFLLVRQLVLQAANLHANDSEKEQHEKLRAHVAGVCVGSDGARIADFLGELIGAPSQDRASPELRAARNDPQIMALWLRRSFREWLHEECGARPLLLVLEDVHWGDLPSVTYLSDALGQRWDKPLMALAMARPEVHDAFPNLWPAKHEVRLGGLGPRAAERLVRAVLDETVASETIARIVERADGNAFYLEELVRRVAEGGDDSLPDTVLALVQSRLERLEVPARRVVRAASILGEVFSLGGVAALLGESPDAADVGAWLGALCDREVIAPALESRSAGEREYRFQHALLRETAYTMLTDADRIAGHRLAGDWLERANKRDALAIVEHFERGQAPERARPWLLRAAQGSVEGGSPESAFALAERGLLAGATGAQRGEFVLVQSSVAAMRGDWAQSLELGREALALLPSDHNDWAVTAGYLFLAGMTLGDPMATAPMLQAVMSPEAQPRASGPWGTCIYCVCLGLLSMDQVELARGFAERAEAVEKADIDPDPAFVSMVRVARSHLHLFDGRIFEELLALEEARRLSERTSAAFGRAAALSHSIQAFVESGDRENTERYLRDLNDFLGTVGLEVFTGWSVCFVAWGRLNAGLISEAIEALRSLLHLRDSFLVPCARCCLAYALAEAGDFEGAKSEANAAYEETAMLPPTQAMALGALALVALRRGQPEQALDFLERARKHSTGAWPSVHSIVGLTRAEALHRLGRTAEARDAISGARDRILQIAAALGTDSPAARAYLTNIGAHARTLQLAREWLGDG